MWCNLAKLFYRLWTCTGVWRFLDGFSTVHYKMRIQQFVPCIWHARQAPMAAVLSMLVCFVLLPVYRRVSILPIVCKLANVHIYNGSRHMIQHVLERLHLPRILSKVVLVEDRLSFIMTLTPWVPSSSTVTKSRTFQDHKLQRYVILEQKCVQTQRTIMNYVAYQQIKYWKKEPVLKGVGATPQGVMPFKV